MIRIVYGESFYEYVSTELQPYLTFSARISLSEHYIYGSSRLGTRMVDKELYRNLLSYQGLSAPLLEQEGLNLSRPAYNMACGCVEDPEQDSDEDEDTEQPGPGLPAYAHVYRHRVGYKQYELTNHLGNVLATVLDRRTGQLLQLSDTAYAWYQADVPSAQDYYPFGMQMPRRVYVADTIRGYRYGFNGMEQDDEVKGSGNSYDFGARMYDSRLGRWWSVDPLASKYPELSPYNFVANMPIIAIDPDGKEIILVGTASDKIKTGLILLQLMETKEGRRIVSELAASKHKIVIFNDPGKQKNQYLGRYEKDGVTYHEINFNPLDVSPFEEGTAKEGKTLSRSPVVSLYHELRHAEQKVLGISSNIEAVHKQGDKKELNFDEVDAVFGENLVRRELGMESRDLYEGIQVSGVSGVRALSVGEYSTEVGAGGSAYEFVRGDYSLKFKTLNQRGTGIVKIEVGKTTFKPKGATTKFSADDNATTFR